MLSAKALARNHQAMAELLKATLLNARFDEVNRLQDLISQIRNSKEQSITGSGHMLAITSACSNMSPLADINEQWNGMSGIKKIKRLDDSLSNTAKLKAFSQALTTIHQLISSMPMQILSIAEKEHQAAIQQNLSNYWQQQQSHKTPFTTNPVRGNSKQAWLANSQVSFCAKAYPTVPVDHDDAAALTVLGGFLRNGFLHTAIREKGGAYGSGASQDSSIAAFRFFSYRDPRITGTLNDFDASIQWMLTNQHKESQLEEAILGVISSLDKPSSPAGEAKQAFHNQLFGRTAKQRQAFRQKVLTVSLQELQEVTKKYLLPENASIAVISNENNRQELEELELNINNL